MLIAITGSSGFIGKYLARHILGLGHEVRLIQRKKGPNVFYIKDIELFDNWAKALEGVDVLIHCASKVHCLDNSLKNNYEEYENINVLATKKIAIQCVKSKVKRFIFLSSVKVNGESNKKGSPFHNDSPLAPCDYYSQTKLRAENILKSISKKEKLEIVLIRPPLVYGPNVGANFLRLLEIVHKGIPLPFSRIKNKRSIIYVENLVSFISACLTNESAINKTFLVSDLRAVSTPELIKLIAKFFKKKSRLFRVPVFIILLIGFFTRTNKKFDKLLNSLELNPQETFQVMEWEPPFSTEYGIKKTVNWFKKYKK